MIRAATPADLSALSVCAQEFYASSQFLRGFDLRKFVDLWTTLISNGTGVVLIAYENNEPIGAISGMYYPEAYSDVRIAQEFFWFVRPHHRGMAGMRLYRAFEQWAKEQNCQEIRMGHLADLMPEKVAHVYRKMGFVPVETNYRKSLEVQSSSALA